MTAKRLSVIIPAYNEEKTIRDILQKVYSVNLAYGFTKEVIVVNDCSTDGTGTLIDDFIRENPHHTVKYFRHNSNLGKGSSIHTGICHATGDYLIIQDADLEYDPAEFNLLLKPIVEDHADVVYGSRLIGGNPHRVMFFWHSIGNKLLTFFSNIFTNLNLTDMESCYKLFKIDIIKLLKLKEKRFGFEPEVTAKMSRISGVKVYEVGISYYGRTYSEGKKINLIDGFRALYCIIKYNIWSK